MRVEDDPMVRQPLGSNALHATLAIDVRDLPRPQHRALTPDEVRVVREVDAALGIEGEREL